MTRKTIAGISAMLIGVLAAGCDLTRVRRLSDGRSLYAGGAKPSGRSVIEGRVIDSVTRNGIRNARVEMKNANMGVGYYLTSTDAAGNFKIDDFIPYVQYVVEVSADGYVTHTSSGPVKEGSLTIEMKPEAVLAGVITNSRGELLKGIEVKIRQQDHYYDEESGASRPKLTASNGSGAYRFDKLSAGSYLVTFSSPGYITETARIKNIKIGETFTLPMVMMKPASVSGTVLIEGLGTPAINVDVSLAGGTTYSTSTFQDGSFRIDDVKPGTYAIVLSHQGFYDLEAPKVTIAEGVVKEKMRFMVRPKEPQISVYADRYTFAPGDTVEFNIRSFRLESFRAVVYRVPIDVLMRGGTEADRIDTAGAGFKTVTSWEEPIKEFEPYEWRYQTLQVKTALPTGGYCVEVLGAGRVVSRKFFSLTTVGVVLKRSPASIFAYVTSLVDNTPMRGAKVAVYDMTAIQKKKGNDYEPPDQVEELPAQIVRQGTTDEKGVFHEKIQSDAHLSAIVIAKDGSYAICNTGSPSSFDREKKKYFMYTDRPVYRAGDTVYYKIIAKNRERRFVPVHGEMVHYRIVNREMDSTLDEGSVALDEWGTANAKIVLPRDVNLGTYEIMAGPAGDRLYGRGTFYVEQYRKPEFMIEITPAKDYFINGDTAEFKVEAKYFFGAPLKGALIRFRFYENRLRDENTSYWWEEDYGAGQSYNRIILEGEKYADQEGIAVLRLHAGNYPYDREIVCEATVVDRSNVSITSSNRVRVGRGEFYVKIDPQQNFFAAGERKEVTVRTLTHTGKPVSAKVKAELFRYIWKPWARVYVHDSKPIYSVQVATDAKGSARIELPKQFGVHGEFDLVVTGIDRRDNVISASRVLWIYDPAGGRVSSRFKNLELSLNTTELERAGEVTCLLKSRFTDAYVCLTLEGRDVYETKVIQMTGNIMPVTFSIRTEHAPNLYIAAAMQRKRALYTATAGVSMPIRDTDMKIVLETDRPRYRPGEKASVMLRVTDESGRPLRADLSLAAVDESIFQIRHDHTPLMKDFFYSKISNWVLTSYSYPISLLAGAAKDGKIKIREKFEDTAFWSGSVRTGDDGVVRISFDLPDNLTTWRLTTRGHDREGRVGEKRQTFLVTQDLVARIGMPRFMVEGDECGLIGIVNSNTDRGMQKVAEEFSADDKVLEPDDATSLSLPAFGSARKYYPFSVPRDRREVALQFTARADRDAADALKVKVPVERRGVPFKLYGVGDMAGNRTVTVTPLGNSDDFTFIPESISVTVNPSPVAQMIRAVKFLSEYPYGCIEQTLNRFIPNLALERALRQKGYARLVDEKAKKDLDAKARAGIMRVEQQQNDDGTWGWFAGARGNAFMTGYVLSSLHLARQTGYAVDTECVGRGLAALGKYFLNPKLEDWDAVAYLACVNAMWGRWNHDAFNKLMKVKDRTAYQAAFLLRATAMARRIARLEPKARAEIEAAANGLKADLLNRARKDGRGLYWESTVAERWGWPGGEVEMTAHVLSALTASGDRSTVPAQVVRSLSARSRGDAWSSTKETATVMLALCEYIESAGGEPVTAGKVRFTMDEKTIAEIAFDIEAMKTPERLGRKVPLDGAPRNAFTVTADGTAGPDMSFDVTVAGTLSFKERGIMSAERSGERGLRALSNGIGITRTFAAIQRVRDAHNTEYLVPQSLADRKEIRIGDELLVKVKFSAQDDFQYLVLEDYLPSGFEVTTMNAYNDYRPFVHIERWDNRMVYFFTGVQKNEVYEVAYIVRAELPGTFMARPSRMECMYEPSIQGWSAPAVVQVRKK